MCAQSIWSNVLIDQMHVKLTTKNTIVCNSTPET